MGTWGQAIQGPPVFPLVTAHIQLGFNFSLYTAVLSSSTNALSKAYANDCYTKYVRMF